VLVTGTSSGSQGDGTLANTLFGADGVISHDACSTCPARSSAPAARCRRR
jgi:hypothetical protein